MQPNELIEAARLLARTGGGSAAPQTYLRRAVSTAHYGLFHCLCRAAADTLVGEAGDGDATWARVYRGLDHGSAKRTCRNAAFLAELPEELRFFAEAFAALQEKRHIADYEPNAPFRTSQVEEDIDLADLAIARFRAAPPRDRRTLAAAVLFERRA